MDSVQPRVLVVMGVSGSAKSTLARMLAGRLSWDFAERVDMHPQANKVVGEVLRVLHLAATRESTRHERQ
jgi:ABC-type proline/glycine betaine transport system ATPase subunit